MKTISRMDLIEEYKLRLLIREGIKTVNKRNKRKDYDEILEESQLRSVIRQLLIREGRGKPEGGHKSTAINRLEKLLHNIIDVLEDDFKELATDKDQRDSFRAHIINAVQNTFEPEELALQADSGKGLNERIKIKLDGIDDPRFIKVPRASKEDEDKEEEEEIKQKEDPEIVKKSNFIIPGHDETGAEAAFLTYDKVETQIVDAYKTLHNPEDIKAFYDGLLMNLDLYFKKFEDEIQPSVEAPETAADVQSEPESEEDDLDLSDIADL